MLNKFELAVNSAGIGVWEWEVDTGRLVWSDHVYRVLGVDKTTFVPSFENYLKLIHPDDLQRHVDTIENFLAGRLTNFDVEHRVIINGNVRWIEGHGTLIKDASGKVVSMIGTTWDITEKKQKEYELQIKILELEAAKGELENREQKLKESEQKLYENLDLQTKLLQKMAESEANLISLINNTTDSIWAVDTEYKLKVINDNFKEVLKFFAGREVKEGEKLVEVVDPKLGALWKSFYDRTFAGEVWSIELPIGPNLVENNFNPIYNGEGKIVGASIFSRDITQRKQNEQKVKQNELFLTALFNNIPIGMEVYTSDGNLQNTNKKADEIYLRKPAHDDTNPINIFSDVFSKTYGLHLWFDEVRKSGKEILDKEICVAMSDLGQYNGAAESHKWLNYTFYPVKDADYNLTNIVILIEDITSKKLSDQKIALSEEKFYKVFDLSPDVISMFGAEDLIIYEINSRSKDVLGYDKFEMMGRYAGDLNLWVHENERLEFFNQFAQKGEIRMEATLRRKDRTVFSAFINGKSVVFNDKKYIMTVTRDISELKKKEIEIHKAFQQERILNEELAQREEELRSNQDELRQNIEYQNTLIDQLRINEFKLKEAMKMGKMGIWEVFADTQKIYLSPELQEIYEFDYPQEVDFKIFAEFFPEDSAVNVYNLLIECIKNGRDFSYVSPVTIGKSYKKRKYLNVLGKRIQEPNKPTRVIGISQDITDRKKEEEKMRQKEIELLHMNRQISELKLMALRSVMNPHFIFNSLNSIQYFISTNDRKNAINYLSMFSKLIRGVLNSSVNTKITLEDELEILKYYINLENVRFSDKFDVSFHIDPNIDIQNIEIPSLLIQPYVENALLHGLYNKNSNGKLVVIAQLIGDDQIKFVIEDDGVGREEAQRIKKQSMPSHKSVGMAVTKERLKIINLTHEVVEKIEDLYDDHRKPCGTRVTLLVKID